MNHQVSTRELLVRSINYVEVNNAGMPVRIVFHPGVPGVSMKEKKAYCEKNLDWPRLLLTCELRGYGNSYGVLVTNPAVPMAHYGAVFFDPCEWHDMCGHSSMSLACCPVRTGLVLPPGDWAEIVLDTPAGLVKLAVNTGGRVRMLNVPSYVLGSVNVESKGLGQTSVYVAYGGNYYGIVDLDELGLDWGPRDYPVIVEVARELWKPVSEKARELGVEELYGFRFIKRVSGNHYLGVLVYGGVERPLLDQSPSGTRSSTHLAHLYYKGLAKPGDVFEFESAIGTVFAGRVVSEAEVKGMRAVVPEISTSTRACYITSYATAVLEPDDLLGEGFPPLLV